MKVFVALFALLASAMAAPMEYPAGLSPAACPNYPFCNTLASPADAFQAAAVARIQQTQYDLSQPIVPDVPGLDAHFAAEAQVLAAQGRVPGSIVHSGQEARVRQAEADLIALQQQQQYAFTGLVGPSGVVGPSGLVGPAGPLAF